MFAGAVEECLNHQREYPEGRQHPEECLPVEDQLVGAVDF